MSYIMSMKSEMSPEFIVVSSFKAADAVSKIAEHNLIQYYFDDGSFTEDVLDMHPETWNDWMATLLMGYEINA